MFLCLPVLLLLLSLQYGVKTPIDWNSRRTLRASLAISEGCFYGLEGLEGLEIFPLQLATTVYVPFSSEKFSEEFVCCTLESCLDGLQR